MKKVLLKILILCMAICSALCVFTACGESPISFKINFVVDSEIVKTIDTAGSETITLPENPIKDGYTFDGWFWDKDVWEKPFTANSLLDAPLSSDMSVYAKFTKKHKHNYTASVTEPTCTEKGYTTYTCDCGESYKDDYVDELGHNYNAVVTEPTCSEQGYTAHICARCQDRYIDTYTDALNHDYGDWIITKAPTCTETGIETRYCSHDNTHTETRTVNALNHDYGDWIITKAPTCTETGIETRYCSHDNTHTETRTVNTLTHNYNAVETKPTCTEQGFTTYTCSRCSHSFVSNYKAALGHKFTNYISDGNATYESDGTKTAICDNGCGTTDTVIDTGSKLEKGIEFRTLAVEGRNVYGCLPNKQSIFDFGEEIEEQGEVIFSIKDISSNEIIESKVVSLKEGDNEFYITVITNDANYDLVYNVCIHRRKICDVYFCGINEETVLYKQVEEGYYISEPDIIPSVTKEGYSFSGWDYAFNEPITQDTIIMAKWVANIDTPYEIEYYIEELDGKYKYSHTEGMVGETDKIITITPNVSEHYFINDGRSILTGRINSDGNTVFEVWLNRKTYNVLIYANSSGSYLSCSYNGTLKYGTQIPSINVSVALGYTFQGWYANGTLIESSPTLNAFIIDKDIEYIATCTVRNEMENFYFNSSVNSCRITEIKDKTVKEIIVPDYVTAINQGAFSDCSFLESITIPLVGSVAINGSINTHFGYIFGATSAIDNSSCVPSSLKTVIITGGNRIEKSAFYGCLSVTSITIPDNITSIGETAFGGCSSLTSITIPDSVTYIGDAAFGNCSSLTSITIPNSVTSLSQGLLSRCSSLTSIIIPDSVTSIGMNAFRDCSKLVEVVNRSDLNITKGSTDYGYLGYYALNVKNYGESDIVNQNGYLFYTYADVNYLLGYVGTEIELVLPDSYYGKSYEIYKYAFSGCSNLTSITIPFVGATLNGSSNTHFGYIFGADSYSKNSSYVPSSLKTVIITGGNSIEKSAFSGCSSLMSITISDSVTSIGSSAFSGCSNLTSITIPDSVTSIGSSAFSNCSSLKSIIIPNSITRLPSGLFSGCSDLIEISIPDSVTSIGENAFSDCACEIKWGKNPSIKAIGDKAFWEYSGTSIIIPDSVTSIGEDAFGNCSDLTSVTIPNSVTEIGEGAFYKCSSLTSITIPDSVTSIGRSMFSGCSNLTSITIPFVGATLNGSSNTHFGYIFGADSYNKNSSCVPSSLKTVIITGGNSIKSYAFSECKGLTSITIPDSVKSIGSYAFFYCSSLISIKIPNSVTSLSQGLLSSCSSLTSIIILDSVTSIGDGAFRDCTSLINITIPNSVTEIGEGAFYNCSGLISIIIPDSVTSIGSSVFYNCRSLTNITIPDSVTSIGDGALKDCTNLINITIHDSVTDIGDETFYGCSSLTSIIIPDSITSIGRRAFGECRSLTSIIISDSVTTIENETFYGCSKLTSIIIPNSVTSIGRYAFYNCYSLTSVTIGNSVTSIGDNAFDKCYVLIEIINNSCCIIQKGSSNYGKIGYYSLNIKNGGTSDIVNQGKYLFYSYNSVNYLVSYIGNDNELVLPKFYNGQSYEIFQYAFYNNCRLTSITIPNSVTNIGSNAFLYCYKLVEVINKSNLNIVKRSVDYGYVGCYALTIHYGESKIAKQDGYLFITDNTIHYLLGYIGTDTAIKLPANYDGQNYEIYQYAFSENSGLTSIIIPDSVTSIKKCAFYGCSSLSNVTIGNSVTSIGNSAFRSCSSLTSVKFSDTTTWYRTESSTNWRNKTDGTQTSVTDTSWNVTYFKSTYDYYWYKL